MDHQSRLGLFGVLADGELPSGSTSASIKPTLTDNACDGA